jgi:CRP-like cAMP-binding protein
VQIDTPDQRKITVGQVWPGECVGEMSLLTGDPYSATVFAKTDARLLAIPKEAFADLFKLYPALVDQLTKIMTSRALKNHALLAAPKTQPESAKSLAGRICAFFNLVKHSQGHSLEMVR